MPLCNNRLSDLKLPIFKNTSKRYNGGIIEHEGRIAGFTKKMVNFRDHFKTQKQL
jgi:hypothetical protein